jgi:hypothetical protein
MVRLLLSELAQGRNPTGSHSSSTQKLRRSQMKKLTVFLCSLMLVFSVAGYASAVSFSVEHNYGDMTITESFSDTFYFPNVDPAAELITDASISITHRGNVSGIIDREVWIASDGINTRIGRLSSSSSWTTDSFGLSSSVIDEIMDHTLWRLVINLNETTWDPIVPDQLTLRTAIFAGNYNESSAAPVPEPSTILLMGAGLLGLVAVGRRKFNRKE